MSEGSHSWHFYQKQHGKYRAYLLSCHPVWNLTHRTPADYAPWLWNYHCPQPVFQVVYRCWFVNSYSKSHNLQTENTMIDSWKDREIIENDKCEWQDDCSDSKMNIPGAEDDSMTVKVIIFFFSFFDLTFRFFSKSSFCCHAVICSINPLDFWLFLPSFSCHSTVMLLSLLLFFMYLLD